MASYQPNQSNLTSWVPVPPDHPFSIQNLPFGIFAPKPGDPRPGVAIGDHILDLAELNIWEGDSLNGLMARPPQVWSDLRARVSWLLNSENPELRDTSGRALHRAEDVELLLPAAIGDYVDFYSSLEHATNVGSMFRDPANPLLPNWRWLPIGYHGKSGTVSVSGTPVKRPKGQLTGDNQSAVYAPCRRLDIELETGFFLGSSGDIFGLVLLNDWSARDIQRWEYQPLGPFLAKSFLTSISPWVVTLDALTPFRVDGPEQQPAPLPHLQTAEPRNYDIHLEVWLQPASAPSATCIARTNFRHMYWSMRQQVQHLTSNGAPVRAGDLCGSGTISGPTRDSFGSLLELAWNGTKPITLDTGETRAFLEDGDTITLRGWCQGVGYRVGFGDVTGTVVPA
ncbi:fumarylacetoacetase [uncultured Paludibaculum sp.]|uniref:fumarylacetoacetase n=1 Tax=uncultured Paludibaculum sp. TaxID=1765020 RepID=UPI002AAAD1EC|nr:fumarylacetoacetase [uncultured Paludibaculum sp.]